MLKILKEPFPLKKNPKRIIQQLLVMSALVYFMLVVFKPFGLKDHFGHDLYLYSGGFVLVGLVYLMFHFLVIEPFLNESKWTLGKEVLNSLFILFVIGLLNALYYLFYENDAFSFTIIVAFVIYTLLIGIIPVTVNLILRKNSLEKHHDEVAQSLDHFRQEQKNDAPSDCTAELKSSNPDKTYRFNCSDLILLKAQDNYVQLFVLEDGKPGKKLIRNTMKQCAQNLVNFPCFFRCHRSYIVNLDSIETMQGNAQGLKLKLKSIDETVPVSRHLVKAFKTSMMQSAT
jgi:DNA-binding LytR/AlgR family response regulator